MLRLAAPAHDSDRIPLRDRVAPSDTDRAEVEQRDGVAVRCEDRHAAPAGRDGARERDRPRGWGTHRRALDPGDIDPAVLTAGIRVGAEHERAQHRAVGRP
jgi:hypothetical protein